MFNSKIVQIQPRKIILVPRGGFLTPKNLKKIMWVFDIKILILFVNKITVKA